MAKQITVDANTHRIYKKAQFCAAHIEYCKRDARYFEKHAVYEANRRGVHGVTPLMVGWANLSLTHTHSVATYRRMLANAQKDLLNALGLIEIRVTDAPHP